MAHIKVKGKREVIRLSRERAEKIKNRWLGINGQAKAEFSDICDLGDEWSGQYSQVVEVELGNKQSIEKHEKKYTDDECREIGKALTEYLNEKDVLTLEKEYEYLGSNEVIFFEKLKPEGECKTANDFNISIVKENIYRYQILQNELSAWRDWKGRGEYAKKKELEELQERSGELAESKNVGIDTVDSE